MLLIPKYFLTAPRIFTSYSIDVVLTLSKYFSFLEAFGRTGNKDNYIVDS